MIQKPFPNGISITNCFLGSKTFFIQLQKVLFPDQFF